MASSKRQDWLNALGRALGGGTQTYMGARRQKSIEQEAEKQRELEEQQLELQRQAQAFRERMGEAQEEWYRARAESVRGQAEAGAGGEEAGSTFNLGLYTLLNKAAVKGTRYAGMGNEITPTIIQRMIETEAPEEAKASREALTTWLLERIVPATVEAIQNDVNMSATQKRTLIEETLEGWAADLAMTIGSVSDAYITQVEQANAAEEAKPETPGMFTYEGPRTLPKDVAAVSKPVGKGIAAAGRFVGKVPEQVGAGILETIRYLTGLNPYPQPTGPDYGMPSLRPQDIPMPRSYVPGYGWANDVRNIFAGQMPYADFPPDQSFMRPKEPGTAGERAAGQLGVGRTVLSPEEADELRRLFLGL